MTKLLAVVFGLGLSSACLAGRAPAACEVLSVDEVGRALQASGVRRADGSGFNAATGIDTCRWTGDRNATVELRVYRADSSAESAWKMVFESARVHATRPDAAGRPRARSLVGVGDDAMVLPGSGAGASVAFRAGRTGGVISGTAAEDALIELAKRAAGRL